MGEYAFSVYFKWQISVSVAFDRQIIISILFLDIHFSVSKYAKGFNILGWKK